MTEKHSYLAVGESRIAYREFRSPQPVAEAFIFHGGGLASMDRSQSLANALLDRDLSAVIFDHSGHGRSSGSLSHSSLSRRLEEGSVLVDNLRTPGTPLVLIGFSMGGQTVIDLSYELQEPPAIIVLCAPAAYAREASRVRFDSGFSEAIRKAESWTRSDAFSKLAGLDSGVLLVLPESDEVIPEGVTEGYRRAASSRRDFELIEVHGASHQLGKWLSDHPDDAAQIARAVERLVATSKSRES